MSVCVCWCWCVALKFSPDTGAQICTMLACFTHDAKRPSLFDQEKSLTSTAARAAVVVCRGVGGMMLTSGPWVWVCDS